MASEHSTEPVPGIVVFEHSVVQGKNAIVFGTSDVLAIDACMLPSEASAMVNIARGRGRRVDYLAITHGHPDHVLGSGQFENVEVIAHSEHDNMVRNSVAKYASKTDQDPDELYESLAHPSMVLERSFTIDLGGRPVELFHTPGHTPDSICAFLPEDGVLIASDTVVTAIVPAITDGNSLELETSLRSLANRDASVLVPGHGPVVTGAESVRHSILWPADYLRAVRERVIENMSLDLDDLISAVPFQEFVGSRFDADTHGMQRRHRMAVEKIAAEVTTR